MANRSVRPILEGCVGQNCKRKFRMLKNSSDVRSCSGVSGLMKSTFGAAGGAGVPRNCERVALCSPLGRGRARTCEDRRWRRNRLCRALRFLARANEHLGSKGEKPLSDSRGAAKPFTRPRLQCLLGAFFTLSMASLPASLASPAILRAAPFTWSALPSVSSSCCR